MAGDVKRKKDEQQQQQQQQQQNPKRKSKQTERKKESLCRHLTRYFFGSLKIYDLDGVLTKLQTQGQVACK